MKKQRHYWLIIGGSILLAGTIVSTLTATILTSDKTQHWNINPYQNYDFNQTQKALLKAEIAPELVNQYLTLAKKITGVTKTNEVIKASEILTLDNKIINTISQRIIWNNENAYQVQSKIDLVKPILMQFYQYYDYIYVKQNSLENDTLNNMHLKSANTDLYKWSIGATISDYNLIKNYLTSVQAAWISKMSISYILTTFLNKKIVWYNSLIDQTNNEITNINQEIKTLLGNKSQLLENKIDAQNQTILVSKMLSSINSWESKLDLWYGLTIASYAVQLSMTWFPIMSWILTFVTLGFSEKYTNVEKAANNDLKLETSNFQEWLEKSEQISHKLEIIFKGIASEAKVIKKAIENIIIHIVEIAAEITELIMGLLGTIFLVTNYSNQKNIFADLKVKIANPDSNTSNAIASYINDLDHQMNDISITISNLNAKENDYMKQKIEFNGKLNQLVNNQNFFKEFDLMNNQRFMETNLFPANQIENWQKAVQKKYGYLTANSATSDDFITAFTNEKNNFNNKYLNVQTKEQEFFDSYNNNDKEYFSKNFLLYIDNPLTNNSTYFNNLNLIWNKYDDILKK